MDSRIDLGIWGVIRASTPGAARLRAAGRAAGGDEFCGGVSSVLMTAQRRIGSITMATPAADRLTTAAQGHEPVVVTRRIEADAATIFGVLADPRQHTQIDGSDMLRGALTHSIVTGVGDVFVLKMYYSELGDYEMANRVVEFEPNRRITWEPERNDIFEPSWGHRWGYELVPDGRQATIVSQIYDCSAAPEDARVGMNNGRIWIGAMTKTLERLDQHCTGLRDRAA
jgi:uncharacterized protein YndB with AHSA1/START domain